jgi:outer membrane protein TolC
MTSRTAAALVLAAVSASAAPEGVERTFTLAQSVQSALQNNHEYLSAQDDVRIARQRIREAQSHYLPTMALTADASRYRSDQSLLLPPDVAGALLPQGRNLDPDTYYSTRLTLRQFLYDGGRLRDTVRLARAGLEKERIHAEEIHGRVVFETERAFYDLLLAKRRKALTEEALGDARRLGRREEAGFTALESRLRRRQAAADHDQKKAFLRFLNILGMELYTRVDVEGDLEPGRVGDPLDKLLAQARATRLEIRGTEYQREIDQLAVNLLEAERFPVVALGAGYGFQDREFPLRSTDWHTTLKVSLPLFDGFAGRSRIRQQKIQAGQNRLTRSEVEDKIDLEVREGHADLVYWRDEVARRRVEAESLRRLIRAQGGTALDRALRRELQLEADTAYWEAVHGHRLAVAQLERTVGRRAEE